MPADSDRGTIELEYFYKADTDPGPVYQNGTIKILYNKVFGGADGISYNEDYVYTGNPSKAGLLVFGVRGDAFQGTDGKEIHLNVFNTIIDALSPVDDELEFTIKYIA